MKKILIFTLFTSLAFTACQSVIEPDLNNVEPQLVIEGEITNQAAPYTIKLSKTTDFTASSQFVGVADALVIVSDDMGTIDTLKMTESGIYKTSKITGIPLHKYTLRVVSEGKEYTATSTMPQQILLDTLYESEEEIIGQKITYLKASFLDPANEENQYRFKLYKNSIPQNDILNSTDQYFNGLNEEATLNLPDKAESGDTIRVDFMCIDKSVYTYFYSLELTLSSQSAVPANPISNITGGCLGYFSAHTLNTKKIILK